MSKPLISIGLTTWNRATILKEAIDSLLAQTYKHFELIICDHSSSDNTEKICRAYERKDKRVRYYKSTRDISAVNNFNYALSLAKGEYFMWAADDDRWDARYIETLLQLLQKNPKAVLAASNLTHFKDSYVYTLPKHTITNDATQLECVINYIKTGRLSYFYGLYKTSVLKKTKGYHSDFRPFFKGSDYLTILKPLLIGKMVCTNEVLYSQRDSGYYFQRFEVFKNLNFNKQVIKRIFRYSSMIFYYTFDLVLSHRYTSESKLTLKEKLIVTYYIWLHFFNDLNEYTYTIGRGVVSFIIGIKKITFPSYTK